MYADIINYIIGKKLHFTGKVVFYQEKYRQKRKMDLGKTENGFWENGNYVCLVVVGFPLILRATLLFPK